jgi:hypothetical protein
MDGEDLYPAPAVRTGCFRSGHQVCRSPLVILHKRVCSRSQNGPRRRGWKCRTTIITGHPKMIQQVQEDQKSTYRVVWSRHGFSSNDQIQGDADICPTCSIRPVVHPDESASNRPSIFRRPPSNDERYHYGDFDSFAFSATRLARPDRLRRPYQLKDHDVRQDEWAYFVESLSSEAYRQQRPHHHNDHNDDSGGGDSHPHRSQQEQPRLTKDVQDLLRAWQHGYFGPRAVQVYVSRGGKKVYDHGYGVPSHRAAMSMHDGRRSVYTDTTTMTNRYRGGGGGASGSSGGESETTYDSREEARFSARERAYRREKRRRRARERREERRAVRRGDAGGGGEWEVHFEYTAPTVHGVKSVKYGEKLPYERPS